MTDVYTALDCAIHYVYGTAPSKVVRDIYGDEHHPSYLKEKERLVVDLPRLWGALDREHRERLCEAAWKYGVQHCLVVVREKTTCEDEE
jgi:hypothetical protein